MGCRNRRPCAHMLGLAMTSHPSTTLEKIVPLLIAVLIGSLVAIVLLLSEIVRALDRISKAICRPIGFCDDS